MIGFLRYLGLLNAAVWLGATVSFTFALGPAFFSNEMKTMFPPPYNGAAAQLVLERYFILHYCCGAIALLHFFWEKLYLGKTVERFTLSVLSVIIVLGLAGGFWFQPKLRQLHLQKYATRASLEQRTEAARSFGMWHGVSSTINIFVMGGLLLYLWRVSNPSTGSRFIRPQKFRG